MTEIKLKKSVIFSFITLGIGHAENDASVRPHSEQRLGITPCYIFFAVWEILHWFRAPTEFQGFKVHTDRNPMMMLPPV